MSEFHHLTMGNRIDHVGVIETIDHSHIRVRIDQASACSSCQVKSVCSSAESKEKIIDVWDSGASQYEVGQRVLVFAALSMGRLAVALAFVIPLVLMFAWVVVSLKVLLIGELMTIAGVGAILFLYFLLLSLFRSRLSRSFSFQIERMADE